VNAALTYGTSICADAHHGVADAVAGEVVQALEMICRRPGFFLVLSGGVALSKKEARRLFTTNSPPDTARPC